MAITQEFEYIKPTNSDQVIQLLKEYGTEARILAGGTDLSVNLKENLIKANALIDIKGLPEINKLECSEDALFIGAGVTFNQLIDSVEMQKNFPVIIEAAQCVGSKGLRNRATMVGNICSCVPCLDSAANLLNYEAVVHVATENNEREIPVIDWFKGPRQTALGHPEFVTGISIRKPEKPHAACYVKLKRVRGEDLAQAGVGVMVMDGFEYRIAFTALGPLPTRGYKIEALLKGHALTSELIGRACKLIPDEISPITDIRASQEYRLHMTGIMLERALLAAQDRLSGNGPEYGSELV